MAHYSPSESDILYQHGTFWVCKSKHGFEVYRDETTHAVRCYSNSYEGAKGLERAMLQADKLHNALDTSRP